jgi:hypothetical protein
MTRGRALLFVAPLLLVAACGGDAGSFVSAFASLPEHDQLAAAAETVEVGGVEVSLVPYLWRDFMPPTPAEGSDMMAAITVKTTDGSPVPTGLELARVYVVNGDEVWVSNFFSEGPPGQPPSQVEEVARGGPRWGPAIDVDVYVKLDDGTGATTYLAARAQPINATY